MRVGLAADHAGQVLKASLERHLRGEFDRAIFCCGSGIGPAIAANKIAGVRATVAENEWSARDGVSHVDVNFLTLGERVIGDELAKAIVDAYLGASALGGRHERRRKQIESMEPRPMTTADAAQGVRRGLK